MSRRALAILPVVAIVLAFSTPAKAAGETFEALSGSPTPEGQTLDTSATDQGAALNIASIGEIIPSPGELIPPIITPVPEPEIYAMLAAGIALFGFAARRKKRSR